MKCDSGFPGFWVILGDLGWFFVILGDSGVVLGDFLDDLDDGFCLHRHVKMELSITVFDLLGSCGPSRATLG